MRLRGEIQASGSEATSSSNTAAASQLRAIFARGRSLRVAADELGVLITAPSFAIGAAILNDQRCASGTRVASPSAFSPCHPERSRGPAVRLESHNISRSEDMSQGTTSVVPTSTPSLPPERTLVREAPQNACVRLERWIAGRAWQKKQSLLLAALDS